MKFKIIVVTFTAVALSLLLDELSCKPLPLPDGTPNSFNGSLHERRLGTRRRRSIPEVDAVNPALTAYQWGPERTGEEESAPADQPPLAPFTADDAGTRFRFGLHKGPPARRGQQRLLSPAESDTVTSDRGGSGALLESDEQYECYRQQGIDPPGPPGGLGASASVDAASPGQRLADRARPSEYAANVYSLYSSPQRDSRLMARDRRIYRPVGVQPEFPVYDDDVDAHMMDPLQGILDEKYWLDPEVREATVRRYIDLAALNMMPSPEQMPLVKRETKRDMDKVSGISALKEGASNCPCQEVVACGSCSRGKDKKSNSTGEDVVDEGISYGRKLLWLARDETEEREDTDEFDAPEQFGVGQLHESIPQYVGRKLLSFEGDEEDEDRGDDKRVAHIEDSIGSISNYSEEEEESNEEDEAIDSHNLQKEVDGGIESWEEDRIVMNKPYFERDDSQGSLKEKSKKHYPDFPMKNSSTLIDPGESAEQEQIPVQDLSDEDSPGYYKPNKVANVIQKAMQKKAKGTHPTTINSNKEFQKVNDELFANISIFKKTETAEPTTDPVPSRSSTVTTSGTVPKAPRENSNLSPDKRLQPNRKRSPFVASLSEGVGSPDELFDKIAHADGEAPLFQSEQAQDAGGAASKNATATENGASTTRETQTSELKYTVTSVSPTLYLTETSTVSPTKPSPSVGKGAKKVGAGDEEAVDAEVANDIVDSVVAESQRGSVLGHRLGVCRRNESLASMRYGRVVPEVEKVIRTVTGCIMDRLKSHLAGQSCVLLETELSDFLNWLVFGGEPYKDYVQKIGEFSFLPTRPPTPNTKCQESLAEMEPTTGEPEQMPPNPRMFAEQPSEKSY